MPSVAENAAVWTAEWDWSTQGDDWSAWWGGSRAMWFGAILPRLHAFLPTGTLLEIAPGYGRWTQYLKDHCQRLVVVDLAENCIDHCKKRFAGASNIEYHVNDGRSLDMVRDQEVDLAVSFDSLVHVNADVLGAYVRQLGDKLSPDGVGVIHHSNMGSYRRIAALARCAPASVLGRMMRSGLVVDLAAWRSEDVTAESFAALCESAGLVCVSQELISWERGFWLSDTVSIFTPLGSQWVRDRTVVRNPFFGREARRFAASYARTGYGGLPDGQ